MMETVGLEPTLLRPKLHKKIGCCLNHRYDCVIKRATLTPSFHGAYTRTRTGDLLFIRQKLYTN